MKVIREILYGATMLALPFISLGLLFVGFSRFIDEKGLQALLYVVLAALCGSIALRVWGIGKETEEKG